MIGLPSRELKPTKTAERDGRMSRKTMYSAINNSPATSLIDAISSVAAMINLESTSYLPDPPNIATIGSDDDAELILYTTKSTVSIGGISRGFNGTTAKAWPVGTPVYRAFTAYDHNAFKENIDLALNGVETNARNITNANQALENSRKEINATIEDYKKKNDSASEERMKRVQTMWNWSACNTGKVYSVSYDNTTKANVGTREDDAVGMNAAPSTDTVKGANDFDSVPIFHSIRANGYVDESGEFVITALEGEPIFSLTGSNGDVWVLFKTCFFKIEMGDTDRYSVSDEPHGEGWFPSPGAIRPDGTLRPFIPIAAYRASVGADGHPASVSGACPIHHISHNTQMTKMRAKGAQYCGQTSKDLFHLNTLMTIEYATRHEKSIVYGCLTYSYQYKPAVTETGVERIILTAAQAANVIVGSCVSIGNPDRLNGTNPNLDRNIAKMNAKADRVLVTRKETLADGNVAVYVDNGGKKFDTTPGSFTASGTEYEAPTYISSMPWWTGSTDSVLGPTGSPGNLTNGKYDMRYRYVETVWGNQYVILSDEIRKGNKIYTCYDCTKFATSLTSDYEEVGYSLEFTKLNAWSYVSRLGFDPKHPSVLEATECAANSTTGYSCGRYINDNTTALFAVWAGCHLSNYAIGGPRARYLSSSLTVEGWYSASRLSATGRCGRVASAA